MLIKFSYFRLSCAILSSVCLNEAITFAFLLQVFLWNMDKYTMIRKLEGHHHDVVACDFSPDGALLATASYDTRVYIWDPHTGHIVMEFGHLFPPPTPIFAGGANDRWVRSVSFSHDGLHVASLADDK